MTAPKRLLVLAIDAASPALLKRWAADGTLPNIAELIATGLVGDTRGIEDFFVGSTWPSFYTGLSPAGHGTYWLEQLKTGTYRNKPRVAADFARRKSLWEVLSDAGRRVLVLDVPLSRLTPGLNGVQVVEWRTHDVVFGMQTTPATLKARIQRNVGEHPAAAPCDAPSRSLAEYRHFTEQLVRGAAARARLTRELLAEEPWDFAIQVFNEAHCAGHQLWHFHDPAHPAFDAAITQREGDLVRTVYAAVDAAVGEIMHQVEPGTTVVLMTLHGMSYTAGASRLLRDMLTRLGVTTPPSHDPPPGPMTPRERVTHLLRTLYHLIPQSIRRPFYDIRAHIREDVLDRGSTVPIDPRRTQCFYVEMGPLTAGIRLNLIGREPTGTIAPGADAAAFCAQLTEQLLEFVDPESGRQLIRRVRRTADVCQGAWLEDLPDLLVEWDLDRPVGSSVVGNGGGAMLRAQSSRTGVVEILNEYGRTGEHRIEGMFIARGPGIAPGQIERVLSTLDLAPTFAALLGSEMAGVDGTVIPELADP